MTYKIKPNTIDCVSNCLTCTTYRDKCSTCIVGEFLDTTYKCESCTNVDILCLECIIGKCLKCSDKYLNPLVGLC